MSNAKHYPIFDTTLDARFTESAKLERAIKANLKGLGF